MTINSIQTAGFWSKAVLASSVLLSFVLLALIFRWSKEKPSSGPAAVVEDVPKTAPVFEAPVPVAATFFVTNQFHWRMLESTNFEQYANNLRGIGCPERTIADILRAELKEHYAEREWMLKVSQPFWIGGRERRAAERRQMELRAELRREHEAALAHFGIRAEKSLEHGDRFLFAAVLRFLIGPVPDEKFWQVLNLTEKYSAAEEEMRERRMGVTTDEDESEEKALNERLIRDLSAVFSAQEFEELAARMTGGDLFGDGVYSQVLQLNAYELRQIAVLKSDRGLDFNFLTFSMTLNEDPERGARFTNGVAQLLGPERFEMFVRAGDSVFKEILGFTQEQRIPVVTAVQLHELRKLAAEQGKAIGSGSTDDAERAQRTLELEEELRTGAIQILGQQAYQEYLGRGGSWLTNSAGL